MDTSEVRLDWLRAFLAVVETGGFTAAAARLHLSQPALHTQVKQLAGWAGPLYRFEGRTLRLTPRGHEVEVLAREVLGAVDRFVARAAGQVATVPVLSAGRALQLYVLAHALRGWSGPLSLRTEDREATIEAVRSGRAHLGLTSLLEADPELDGTRVLEVGQVAIVPEHDPLAQRRHIRARALAGRPLILPPAGRTHRATLAAALGGDLHVAVEVDGWELMTHYASLGLGLTVVNAYVPTPPGTVAVPVVDLPRLQVHLIKRRAAPRIAEVAALEAHVRKHLAQGTGGTTRRTS
ncbi:LysR family transcriptional regulator [Nannocystis radixulma]|uniref:LysR family transcriptional regulator n=1 Tax=Nannocystis radixulma TaxID=2995305 RepID=A0ABT5BF73_9BACT|nr:LysR family transcriptional regulator [Nannocystis radixulma]MDC0672796.1 LysR family transcriptional regulator [Nannocystis radixulma]